MTLFQLFWGTMWRGGAWGWLAGTLLSTAYGAVFANVLIFAGLLTQSPFDLKPSDLPSLIGAMLFMAFIGAIAGGIFGIPTGLVVGIANGFLLGLIARLFFYPLRDVKTFRRVMAIVSGIFTAIASWVGFMAIVYLYANQDKADWLVWAVIVLVPAVIAGIAAGLISQLGVRWYVSRN